MQQYVLYHQRRLLKARIAQELPVQAEELRQKLRKCRKLVMSKVSWKDIAEIVGMSKSSYYRIAKRVSVLGILGFIKQSTKPKQVRQSRTPQEARELVLKLRLENRTYGKAKLAVILRRDHGARVSESTVGRIVSKFLVEGKISRSLSASRPKRSRSFKGGYAQRWEYGMKGKKPGELIQIDHMTATINGVTCKHFQAWDPVTKVIICKVASNATSAAAAKFLTQVCEEAPFAIKSIQVDGCSEFMKDFEAACQNRKIPLYVLPPRRPQWNGGVERGNRTFREEFYSQPNFLWDSVGAINAALQKAVLKYNSYRPHSSLKGMTPFEYNQACSLVAS